MANITMIARNVSLALAQKHDFNPWSVPDDYTVYNFAPDYVKPLLHPHWQTQKAVHPIYAYFFGMYYLVMGKKYIGPSFKLKHLIT
jgi:r-opsin